MALQPPACTPPLSLPFVPFLAWRQLPGLALLQLVVHFGRFVVQPLQVPIGTFEGHFRLDAEVPKENTSKVTLTQGCSGFTALIH